MRRRDFITFVGGAAAYPIAARAQKTAGPVIGFLSSRSADDSAYLAAAYRRGLGETGYSEGTNILIEYRWAEGHYEQLPALAAELVHRRVEVLAATGGIPTARAAKAATSIIPIVFVVGFDPVTLGLVASFNRPSGNLTGVSLLNNHLSPKLLQLLHEALPKAATIGFLTNPTNPGTSQIVQDVQVAAQTIGLRVHVLSASSDDELEKAVSALVDMHADAFVVQGDPFIDSRAQRLVDLSLKQGLPAIFPFREFVAAGGLMSYGSSLADAYRQIGVYTGRILKGERAADLPVMQSTKIELSINLRAAKAIGLTFPVSVLGRADEVIE
jgi:putative ABC transport system substrate-binding protein